MSIERMEENLKGEGMTEVAHFKKGDCRCGGEIATFWGTIWRISGDHGTTPMIRSTKMVGPVCVRCGLLYSAHFFKS